MTNLVLLTLIIEVIWTKLPYKRSLLGCVLYCMFKIALSMRVYVPLNLFSSLLVRVHTEDP